MSQDVGGLNTTNRLDVGPCDGLAVGNNRECFQGRSREFQLDLPIVQSIQPHRKLGARQQLEPRGNPFDVKCTLARIVDPVESFDQLTDFSGRGQSGQLSKSAG